MFSLFVWRQSPHPTPVQLLADLHCWVCQLSWTLIQKAPLSLLLHLPAAAETYSLATPILSKSNKMILELPAESIVLILSLRL